MAKENRGGRPFAGLTVAAILLASTAGYVSALSQMFQSASPFLSEENDFSFQDADEVHAAAPEIASFQQALTRTAPAWFVNAMPGYSSSRARELWYLSLNRSGDGRLSYEAFGSVNDSTNPYQTFNVAQFNNLAPFATGSSSPKTAGTVILAPAGTTYNWNFNGTTPGSNDWSNGASWTPNIVGGPDNPGDIAIINNDITAARTITLFLSGDSGNAVKTVGRLDIGDSNGTHAFTITAGSGNGILEFDSGDASAALLNNLITANATRIGAPIQIKTDLHVTNLSTNVTNNTFTLGGSSAGGITSSATMGTQTITVSTSAGDVIIGGAATGIIGDGSTGGKIAIVKDGTGILQLTTSVNTYSGGTTIKSGTIQYNNSASFGTGPVVLGNSGSGDATLQSTNSSTSPTNNITVASGSGGTLAITSQSTSTTGGNNYSGTVLLNGNLTLNSLFLSNSNNILNFGIELSGVVSGAGGIFKTGAGTATLVNGSNTYSGGTTVSAGTLAISSSGTVTAGGAVGSGPVGTGTLTLGDTSTFRSNTTIARSLQNNLSLSGSITLGDATANGALTFNSTDGTNTLSTPATATLTGNTILTTNSLVTIVDAISGGSFTLTKGGASTLTFGNGDANANSYTGVTTVNAGELDLNKADGTNAIAGNLSIGDGTGTDTVKLLAANQIANTSDVTINSSGVFNLNGNNETIDALNSSSATASILLGSGTLTVGANNETSFSYAGTSSGTGGLTKTGSGTFILSGANNYTGNTTIKAGELFLAPAGTLAAASTIHLGDTITNSPSAMFTFGSTSGGISLSNPLIVDASASGTQGTRTLLGLAESGNTNTYSGTVTMNADLTVQSAAAGGSVANGQGTLLFQGGSIDVGTSTLTVNTNLRANNADTYSIQGIVRINELLGSSLATGGGVVKDGSGALILQGTSNTYTGTDASNLNNTAGTKIGGGILGIFGDGSLGLAPANAANNVYFIAPGTNTNTDSIGPTLRADAAGITLASTRNINIASGITARFDSNGNTFTIAGNINGAGNLNKVGPGILALTGANTYTGTTTVSAGTLNAAVTNALGGTTGSITVNRGGTLLVSGDGNLNRINDTTPIVLGSATGSGTATFQKGDGVGVSEGTGASRNGVTVTGTSSAGLGALSLQSNATFDFGSVGVGTFTFGTFTSNTNTLTILNWTSNASLLGTVSGIDGTDDRLIFSGAPTDIASINFNGTPAAFILLDTGFYEVVPVPEPSTWIGAGLALAAIAVSQRKRLRKTLKA